MAALQNNTKGLPKLGGGMSGLPKLGSSGMSGLPKLGSLSSKKVELPKLKLGGVSVPSAKPGPVVSLPSETEESTTTENTVDALLDALGIADTPAFDDEEVETLVVNRSSLDSVEASSGFDLSELDSIEFSEETRVTAPPSFNDLHQKGGASDAPGVAALVPPAPPAPAVSHVPSIPAAPSASAAPAVSHVPSIPAVPSSSGVPRVSSIPVPPSAPAIPKTPSVTAPEVRLPIAPLLPQTPEVAQAKEDQFVQTLPEIKVDMAEVVPPAPAMASPAEAVSEPVPPAPPAPAPVPMPVAPAPVPPAPAPVPPAPVAPAPVASAPVAPAPVAPAPVAPAPVAPVAPSPVAPKPSIPEMTVAEAVASAELHGVPSEQPQPMMSEEAQFAAILASMSPEERAAYEAYELEQARQAEAREQEKMKELREMYGKPSDIAMQRKFPVGLLVALLLIFGGVGFGIYKIMTMETPEDLKPAVAAEPEEVMPEQARVAPLNKYAVKLKVSGATTLFINGEETPLTGEHYFVTGHRNTIMAFGEGMVPYFKTFDPKSLVAGTVTVALEPAVMYQKGIVNFKLSKDMTGIKATFDGRRLGSFPTSIQDVVLGRPHILILEKEGFAKHMHLIWPDTDETNVVIPDLATEYNALAGTVCSLKPFPVSSIKYGVKISYGGQSYENPIVPTLLHGDIIEYYINREQRQDLSFAVVPDGFGTLSIDASLLRASIGEAVVNFRRPQNSVVQPCLRRYGEVICPKINTDTVVPSGPDWEVFGVIGEGEDVRVLRGSQPLRLAGQYRYMFDVSQDSRGTFTFKTGQALKIKQPKK